MEQKKEILTDLQKRIAKYIFKEASLTGKTPTARAIAKATNCALGSVTPTLEKLEKLGYIERERKDGAKKSSSIKISNLNCLASLMDEGEIENVRENTLKNATIIPIIGKVAAGLPILAVENIAGYIPVSDYYKKYEDDLFALKIQGESMIDAGILDGDIVIVNKTGTAEDDDIIVALLDDSVTVKKYKKLNGGIIYLIPKNRVMEPIVVDLHKQHFQILGEGVGVFRYIS